MNLLIFSEKITERLTYTLDTVIKGYIRIDYKLTSDETLFKSHIGAKISYGEYPVTDELFIKANSLLFENSIRPFQIETGNFCGYNTIFHHGSSTSDFPFDVLAAIFYLLSRYEEYEQAGIFHRDKHGRYQPQNSILYKLNALEKPLVDIYSKLLREMIITRYPESDLPKRKLRFISTIDIDNTYAYRYKGALRSFLGMIRSIFQLDFKSIVTRTRVLNLKERDPFDTFDSIRKIHERNSCKPIFFALLGNYSKYDKNLAPNHPALQNLLKETSLWAEIGIHPSYNTPQNPHILKSEIKRLNIIVNQITAKSRQHFLRIMMPLTYKNLLQTTIQEDFSMGYASVNGFRAGTSNSFYWFDLENNRRSHLKITPFCFMDSTAIYYQHLNIDETQQKLDKLVNEIIATEGTITILFHNDNLYREEWLEFYEKTIAKIQNVINK